MNWSFSLKLMPGEKIVDEPVDRSTFGIKTVHTPVLTNKRAMFRFNSLSSGLVQAFSYEEIEDARPANRLMIKYLRLTAGGKDYYMNVDVPEEWALKILGYKEMLEQGKEVVQLKTSSAAPASSAPGSVQTPSELEASLLKLHAAGMLTDAELEEKRSKLRE